ncbi:hypothetical protein CERZMDRAFT_100955 [Cercospora zeae-maydis SCOH1-5]|uniref:F-box domain-containing protein n=1 Tax=Cercospora zeae-maydis SCOH1-5 TaxID=717836 RepID=A0A6A6F5D9_9PEZI|nr:hypothetical protein CERZMDRAFT_100955 [Cercospora zeae-maydis SCOH1-5]
MSPNQTTPPQQLSSHDHLTALPSELLQEIISYLFPTHKPNRIPSRDRSRPGPHDLENLANTCRTLRHDVHAWAHHFLLHHQSITKFKPSRTAPCKRKQKQLSTSTSTNTTTISQQPNYLRSSRTRTRTSQALLTWSTTKCTFCGKPTTRTAILMNGLHCCTPCDSTHWPDKITHTAACREYDLDAHHLDPHSTSTSSHHHNGRRQIRYQGPAVRSGKYVCQGAPTTMFLRQDVEARAREVHGEGWREHLRRRREERAARREKWMEKRKREEMDEERRGEEEGGKEVIVLDGDDDQGEEWEGSGSENGDKEELIVIEID